MCSVLPYLTYLLAKCTRCFFANGVQESKGVIGMTWSGILKKGLRSILIISV